jgi:hypothetical protein
MAFSPALGYLFVNTNEIGQVQGFADLAAANAGRGRGGAVATAPRERPAADASRTRI